MLLRVCLFSSSIDFPLRFKNIFNNNLEFNNLNESGYVVDSLESAFYSLLNTNNYRDAIVQSVKIGYDTDTIACITGSLAGVIYGSENIPQEWLNKLKRYNYLDELSVSFDKAVNKSLNKNSDLPGKGLFGRL